MNWTRMTLGYREVTVTHTGWLGEEGMRIRSHGFHFSTIHPKDELEFSGHLTDARGRDCGQDGIRIGNGSARTGNLKKGNSL